MVIIGAIFKSRFGGLLIDLHTSGHAERDDHRYSDEEDPFDACIHSVLPFFEFVA
jgi:hypothetical protein